MQKLFFFNNIFSFLFFSFPFPELTKYQDERYMGPSWGFARVPKGRAVVEEESAGAWRLHFVWRAGVFCQDRPFLWGEARGLFWETFLDRPCVGFVKRLSDLEETLLRYFNRFRFVVGWSGALRSVVFFFYLYLQEL